MRMAFDHLGLDRGCHSAQVEGTFLFAQDADESDLEEQVAELPGQLGPVAAVDRRRHFVGFLEQVGAQVGELLFAVPRAATRRPQAADQQAQGFEIAARRGVGFEWASVFGNRWRHRPSMRRR